MVDVEVIGNVTFDGYIIGINEEIRRVLITKKGSIPMNPEYGSELYKLRDRTLSDEVKLKAISYTFDAIDRWIKRIKCKKVDVIALNDNKFKLRIEIDPA
jgi:phage baseplate assembly protein W